MQDDDAAPTATLTVDKAPSLPFQDVTVMDEGFAIQAQQTLNETADSLTLALRPGRYMVSGLSPSGARLRVAVELGDGDDRRITVASEQDSPHEWLADLNARNQVPRSAANVSRKVIEALGTRSLSALLEVSPVSSLSLPVGVVSYAAQGMVEDATQALDRRLGLGSRPKRSTRRPQDVSLRSYVWASDLGRWVRSDLIDRVQGDYAMDYTRLYLPPRPYVDDALRDRIHLVGSFRQDQPARFIALPLFGEGAQLVLSHSGGADSAARRFSWYLSAVDDRIDGLLQSIKGRGFEDSDAVSQEAFKVADRALHDKVHDPEAAVVAALFLLRHRRLGKRPGWVENLANWFPWSPDALAVGAWANLLFETGDQAEVLSKLAKIHHAGPPQFLAARRLLRDLLSITRSGDDWSSLPADTRRMLDRLWARLGKEMQREVIAGPFYAFTESFGAGDPSS